MKYLNVGCGSCFSTKNEWTNLDFISTGEGVIAHNLLKGIPFENESFDAVYHSHVLEHFSQKDGENLIEECFRVLKPSGILRIAVPDLEIIARNYLKYLDQGINNPTDDMISKNYAWTLLEMYDQTVRNESGGNMGKYLHQDTIINEAFVFDRIGEEAKSFRKNYWDTKQNKAEKNSTYIPGKTSLISIPGLKNKIKQFLLKKLHVDLTALQIGKFRLSGEIHQWMYDRYSLTTLLRAKGGKNIQTKDAFTSYINDWAKYGLDGNGDHVRKPDSLFMEAFK